MMNSRNPSACTGDGCTHTAAANTFYPKAVGEFRGGTHSEDTAPVPASPSHPRPARADAGISGQRLSPQPPPLLCHHRCDLSPWRGQHGGSSLWLDSRVGPPTPASPSLPPLARRDQVATFPREGRKPGEDTEADRVRPSALSLLMLFGVLQKKDTLLVSLGRRRLHAQLCTPGLLTCRQKTVTSVHLAGSWVLRGPSRTLTSCSAQSQASFLEHGTWLRKLRSQQPAPALPDLESSCFPNERLPTHVKCANA